MGVIMDYPYENLGPEKFQQFCQSLLTHEFENVQCFPVSQADGGRDALSYLNHEGTKVFVVYKIKYIQHPLSDSDPHLKLVGILEEELPKIKKLIDSGAKKFILLTNIPGTAKLNSGSIDKVNKLLFDNIGTDAYCWWRDDLNRRLDNDWDIKWAYPELMTGPDLIRAIIENGLTEQKERRTLAIRAFINDQFLRDEEVRFKQVDLQHNLLDLFIDVPIIPPQHISSKRISNNLFHLMYSFSNNSKERNESESMIFDEIPTRESQSQLYNNLDKFHYPKVGAATLLLNSKIQNITPKIVLEGAPGQGKSTIVQYICQVHRARLLEKKELFKNFNSEHLLSPVKLPFKVDLRDFSSWLGGKDPFSSENNDIPSQTLHNSLETFLAAQVSHHSGGIEFSSLDLLSVLKLSSVLLVLDGLDEVVDIARRQEVIEEIINGVNRLEINCGSLQVIVTSRPSVFVNSKGLPENIFPYFRLADVPRELIDEYAEKWMRARGLQNREKVEIKKIIKDKLDQPHLRELAKNPMQLTILLSLIHSQGSSLPDKRTALYDNYVDLFFNRESEKNWIVRDHRQLLIDIHHYLGWILHSESELSNPNDGNNGRITDAKLHIILEKYLIDEGFDPKISSEIFTGMVERVVALVSRVQGTYEFEVQPLREYFAAKYLYETAPYSPVGSEKSGTLPDRFNAISRDFYWMNVTRFYAGCYSKGELASLIDCLRELVHSEGYKYISHPRILAATLLSDWVFTQHPKSVKEVVELILDGIGLRYVLATGPRQVINGSPLILPDNCGKNELLDFCFDNLEQFPPKDYALDLINLIKSNASIDEIFSTWDFRKEKPEVKNNIKWLEYGLYLGCLSKVSIDFLNQLSKNSDLKPIIKILLRTHRYDFFELKENYSVLVQMILDGEGEVYQVPESNNVLQKFSAFLTDATFQFPLIMPEPTPLIEILNRTLWRKADSTSSDENNNEQNNQHLLNEEYQDKCESTIKIIENELAKTALEWSSEISTWDSIVEGGRLIWGDQWVFNKIANMSAGIKSKNETYNNFSDLLDSSKSLCKRARYARLRAGNPNWWLKQFEQSKNKSDFLLILLILISWGSETTLHLLSNKIDEVVSKLDNEDWQKLFNSVIFFTQTNNHHTKISEEMTIINLDPRTITLLSIRAKENNMFISKFLLNYSGTDPIILGVCEKTIMTQLKSGIIDWTTALEFIKKRYQQDHISDRYAAYLFLRSEEEIQMPEEIAKVILSDPENYPAYLISFAEQRFRNYVATNILPVGEIALRDNWFPLQ
jgi:hypothetical protein